MKLKIQASYCNKGKTLDVGFSQKPNKFLINPDGIDIILPCHKPSNYNKIMQCNLNFQKIPRNKDFYDNIILGDVIEHVENPSFLLRECNRVLKKKGKLIISTPHANDWWTTLHNWFFKKWVKDPDKGEHINNWTILDMQRLLKKNGFNVKKTEGYRFRTPFRKPFTTLFRVKNIPCLAWQVFYVSEKSHTPNTTILTKALGKFMNVKQNN